MEDLLKVYFVDLKPCFEDTGREDSTPEDVLEQIDKIYHSYFITLSREKLVPIITCSVGV